MSDEITLPPRIQFGASMDEVIKTLQAYHDYIQAREPTTAGGQLEKFMTYQTAVKVGLLSFSAGGYASGPSGSYVVPGILTSNPADATPPTPIAGLTVSGSVAHYMVEITAPTYSQGGGNGRTIIYGANYSGSGPLPTFADASERGTIPGRGTFLVVATEPGVATHFWAKAETRHPTLQASPTGGTNGVTATAELIEDQHVLNLSAAKLTAGSIGVSEYIQSTGFVSGSAGWQIKGDGVAEFSGVIVRGTLYATAGTIGGASIATTYVQSSNYNGSSLGWKLDNTAGSITAYQGTFGGTVIVGTSPAVSGSTMTGTGAVLNGTGTFAVGNSTKNLSFDGSTLTLNGVVVSTGNLATNAVTVPLTYSDSGTYAGDGTVKEVMSYTFSMPSAGDVIALWAGVGGYTAATDVTCYIKLDGTTIGYCFAGGSANDSPTAIGFSAASAGSRTLKIYLESSSNFSLDDQKLIVLGVQR